MKQARLSIKLPNVVEMMHDCKEQQRNALTSFLQLRRVTRNLTLNLPPITHCVIESHILSCIYV